MSSSGTQIKLYMTKKSGYVLVLKKKQKWLSGDIISVFLYPNNNLLTDFLPRHSTNKRISIILILHVAASLTGPKTTVHEKQLF